MAQDLLQRLLCKDPKKRLGAGPQGAQEVKSHLFFQGLDWVALAARKIPAPFRPQIRSELDVGNFAEEFTRLEPVYSPAGSPPPGDPRIFQGYSFVAPSILFDHNNAVMADVLAAPGAGYRPGRAAVARSAMMQVGWPGVEMVLALLESSGLVVNGLVPPVSVGMVWV